MLSQICSTVSTKVATTKNERRDKKKLQKAIRVEVKANGELHGPK